jgi:hypothetical protein
VTDRQSVRVAGGILLNCTTTDNGYQPMRVWRRVLFLRETAAQGGLGSLWSNAAFSEARWPNGGGA